MDNLFYFIYCAKVDNDKVTEWDSNLLFPDWYAPTNLLDSDAFRYLKFGYSRQSLIIPFHKGAFKTVKIRTNTFSFAVRA